MKIEPLRSDLRNILKKHQLLQKFKKQKRFFEHNPQHPSLNTEKLQPKHLNIYSFRIDRKWRAVFIITDKGNAEIIDINPHYE